MIVYIKTFGPSLGGVTPALAVPGETRTERVLDSADILAL